MLGVVYEALRLSCQQPLGICVYTKTLKHPHIPSLLILAPHVKTEIHDADEKALNGHFSREKRRTEKTHLLQGPTTSPFPSS